MSCHPNVHVVPYSDHSSYQELEDFLSALRPISIVPIVGTGLPSFSAVFSPRKKRRKTVVPESVQRYMTCQPAGPVHWPGQAFLPQRGARSVPRGVVFESPPKCPPHRKGGPSDKEANPTEDTESTLNGSDCILMDMEQGSIIDVESEVSLRLAEEESEVNMRLAGVESELCLRLAEDGGENDGVAESQPSRSRSQLALEPCDDGTVQTLSRAEAEGNSPNRTGPTHLDRCSSLERISLHDNACVMASAAAATPRDPSLPAFHGQVYAEDTDKGEQWLLGTLVFPEEELTHGSEVLVGLGRLYNLCPLNGPKGAGDPFEAAIKRFRAALG